MTSPSIPVGLATKLGLLAAALSSAFAAVTAILNGDHTPETITALLVAGASVYAVVSGRMAQAAAQLAPPAPTVNIAPPTETVALTAIPAKRYDLASPLLDDPAMDDEPEFTPEELADRSGDLPGSHAAAEQEAYSQFGQPTRSQIEEGNAA